jgi:hypothetical protein
MRIAVAAFLMVSLSAASRAEPAPIVFGKPLACTIGTDCFIQQYMDHEAGSGAADYRCGSEAYDGHDGTDFRVPDKAAQDRGVAVLAAADGVVMRWRDGEPDFDAGTYDPAKVGKNAECGNGVLIDHPGGWQTQYCHMRRGSIRVKGGDVVTAGTELGLVGQSGQAAFIHLHLTVRHMGQPVDPFAFGLGTCHESAPGGVSLWAQADRNELRYRDVQVINAGFAAGPVGADDVERGHIAPPDSGSAALVFYVRAISLRGGDAQKLTLLAPDGTTIAESAVPPLERAKAQYQAFVGKKLTASVWPSGTYRGTYVVTRSGEVIVDRSFALDVP